MIAEEIISPDLFPLKKSDSVETALLFMHDWKVAHLPVVESNVVVGYVTSTDLSGKSASTKMEKLIRADVQFSIPSNAHILDVLKVFGENGMSALAVTDADQHFR